ncbi:MAG: hypothetical protein JXA60_12050 [Candidatus Coatesbacteria bacterium]|nr:hypothetical protein [Candidatus Coatesbacteria bacterium]
MKNRILGFPERRIYIWLALFSVLLVFLSLTAKDSWTDDGVSHYLKARLSLSNTHILIDPWAKPIFNLLYLIPSQFGQLFARLETVLLSILTALFTAFAYKKAYPESDDYDVIVFFIFAQPVFFSIAYDTYTEITAAFILSLFLYFYYSHKDIIAALIASLLPLTRFEGIFLVIAIMLIYAIKRKFFIIIFLLAGLLVWNFAGFILTHRIFWLYEAIINWHKEMYYNIVPRMGDPFYWLHQQLYILGPSIMILCLLWMFLIRFSQPNTYKNMPFFLLSVFFISEIAITVSGKGGSGNHPRFFAFVSPLYAYIAMKAFDVFKEGEEGRTRFAIIGFMFIILAIRLICGWPHPVWKSWDGNKILIFGIVITILGGVFLRKPSRFFLNMILAFLIVYSLYFNLFRGSRPGIRQKTVLKAYIYWKEVLNEKKPVYAYHPKFYQYAENDIDIGKDIRHLDLSTLNNSEKGSIIIWDSWYCPRFNARVEKSFLDSAQNLKLLREFKEPSLEIRIMEKQ